MNSLAQLIDLCQWTLFDWSGCWGLLDCSSLTEFLLSLSLVSWFLCFFVFVLFLVHYHEHSVFFFLFIFNNITFLHIKYMYIYIWIWIFKNLFTANWTKIVINSILNSVIKTKLNGIIRKESKLERNHNILH